MPDGVVKTPLSGHTLELGQADVRGRLEKACRVAQEEGSRGRCLLPGRNLDVVLVKIRFRIPRLSRRIE